MTSRNGGEDADIDRGSGDFRQDIDSAEPRPVTEAMITPRTAPNTAHAGDDNGTICHVCGERNQAGSSYCLSCGVNLATPSPTEPLPWVDDDLAEPEFDAGAGLLDLADIDEATPKSEAEADGDQTEPPAPSLKVSGRQILIGLVSIAVVILLVMTFRTTGTDNTGDSNTTLAVAPSELDSFAASVDAVALTVADLAIDATSINASWKERTTDFQTTLAALSGLESRAVALPDLLLALSAPELIGDATHQRLVTSANTIASAATEMVEGLEAPDSGEARRAALSKFAAAAAEFASLNRVVAQSVASFSATTG